MEKIKCEKCERVMRLVGTGFYIQVYRCDECKVQASVKREGD